MLRKSTLALLFAATIFGFIAILTDALIITVPLRSNEKKCLSEYLTKNMLFLAEVHSNQNVGISISDEEHTIFEESDESIYKTAFTTTRASVHTVCIINMGTGDANAKLSMKWGTDARDYSLLATKENVDDMLAKLAELKVRIGQYKSTLQFMHDHNAKLTNIISGISQKIVIISLLTLLIMGGITYVQIRFFRNFFKSKKVI